MKGSRLMLSLSLAFFLVFFADVIAGAFFRAAFLSDVAAVLTLILSSVFFTIAIVELERQQIARIDRHHDSDTLE